MGSGSLHRLDGRRILLAGSASPAAARPKLERAHQFARALAHRTLELGGGLVLFASGEPLASGAGPGLTQDWSLNGETSSPGDLYARLRLTARAQGPLPDPPSGASDRPWGLTFDWTVLEAVGAHAAAQGAGRVLATVVTSMRAVDALMPAARRELLLDLAARGAVEMSYVPDELYTGGAIRDALVEQADAAVLLGGGKGVHDLHHKLEKRGGAVLPLDLDLGAIADDGGGAVVLHKRALTEPQAFFKSGPEALKNQLLSLSLERTLDGPEQVAHRALALLAQELARGSTQVTRSGSRHFDVVVLTALPLELEIARRALDIGGLPDKTGIGTNFWVTEVRSERAQAGYRVVLASVGGPGNYDAATAAAEMLAEFSPRILLMVGIAAGIRERCKIGEVVLSERIVAYEPAALSEAGPQAGGRPEMFRLDHSIEQDVTAYLSSAPEVRVAQAFAERGFQFPEMHPEESKHVAQSIVLRLATLASGEKLLRDPTKLMGLRHNAHGRIEAGEMEAAGLAVACRRYDVPYLMIRGISDYGDHEKDDRFQTFAATTAAVAMTDFLRHGLLLRASARRS